MTKEEKVKFLAELDGWTEVRSEIRGSGSPERNPSPYGIPPGKRYRAPCNSYLTRYDAIIRLVQKQPRNILTQIVLSMKGQNDVSRMVDWLMFSPEELADILIKVIKVDKAEAIR